MIPSSTEYNLRNFISHNFPPEAFPLQDFLLRMMKHMDNIEIVDDAAMRQYKLILERHRQSIGVFFSYEALHDVKAVERITLELQAKVIEMAKKELGTFGGDPLDILKPPEVEPGDSIAEMLEKRLKGKTITINRVTMPSVSDHIDSETYGSLHFDPISLSGVAKSNNEITQLFEKVKKELSDRGDFEIDVVSFVDALIKLGIAKPKD